MERAVPPVSAETDRRLRVLVVEDDEEMRAALRQILELAGFQVRTASDGIEGRSLASAEAYDILLSDVRLPGQSGLALARSLRDLAARPRVILLTAYPEWKIYEEAEAAGACEVITKPVDLFKLAALIQEIARPAPPPA